MAGNSRPRGRHRRATWRHAGPRGRPRRALPAV